MNIETLKDKHSKGLVTINRKGDRFNIELKRFNQDTGEPETVIQQAFQYDRLLAEIEKQKAVMENLEFLKTEYDKILAAEKLSAESETEKKN